MYIFFEKLIIEKLKKEDKKRQKNSTKISSSQNIGILINKSDIEDDFFLDEFIKKLEKMNNKVEKLLFYTNKKSIATNQKHLFLNKKFFKLQQTIDFLKKEFDVLIFYSRTENINIHKLLCYSKAKFKISPYYNIVNFADFMLIINPLTEKFREFVDLTKKYIFEK